MRLTFLRWQRGNCFVCAMLCFSFLSHSDIEAQEPRLFRLTGVDGELSFRHTRNEVEQGTVGATKSTSTLTTNEEAISFLTHSYVYHPNLLQIDLGAGLLYTQSELETESEIGSAKSESEGELYSLTAQLRFLEKKPYPFTLYYYRVNPSTEVSGTERFVSENVKYGVNASLLEPVLPFSVNMEAFRETSQGSGVTQVVNQTNEQVFLRAYRSLDNDGHVQFTYHNRQQLSESGVRGRPIDRTDRKSESTSLATDVKFGEEKQFKLINLFSYFTQDDLPQQRDFRWTPSLTWRHSAKAESFYRFDYSDSETNAIESTQRSGGIGAHVALTDKLAINGEVRATNNKTVGLQSQSKGASTAVSFTQPLTIGQLQLGAGTSYDLTENEATAKEVSQQNERIRYDGVERLQLARLYVTRIDNIAVERDGVIVVSSLVEDEDFTVDGADGVTALTYINIVIKADAKVKLGDTLIIDYTYKTGGTVAFSTVSYNYSAQLSMFKYYTLYASYSDTEQELKEGESLIPLNSVQYTRMGARVDHPFLHDKYRLGVEAIYEKQAEEISPYIRRTIDTFFQTALTSNTSLRLSFRRVRQDNLPSTSTSTSPQDVDIIARSVTLTTRPWPRSLLRLVHSDEEDTGGTVPHRIKRNLIQLQWRVRKLTLSVDGASADERQGEFTRQTNYISANIIRTF